MRIDMYSSFQFINKEQSREQYAHKYTECQIMSGKHDNNHGNHHDIKLQWMLAKLFDSSPLKGGKCHHNHDRNQRCHWDISQPVFQKNHETEQKNTSHQSR